MTMALTFETLPEAFLRLVGNERTSSGESIVSHCRETLRILADLGFSGAGEGAGSGRGLGAGRNTGAGTEGDPGSEPEAVFAPLQNADLAGEFERGRPLSLLMWVAGALPVVGAALVERHAGSKLLELATSLRSLLQLQSLKLSDGKAALAERELVRQMFFEMSRDPRLVLLSLASRLQTLRFHAASGITPDPDACRFTLQILAPLANRLGLGRLKWELEDLAFRFSSPQRYREIAASLDEKRSQREAFVDGLVQELRRGLRGLGLDPQVSGRPKNIYSIHQKMTTKSVGFDRLLDLRACRVIVGSVDGCYTALDWIHQRFTPLLAEFDDYIARPKPNGYRSLHTVVLHDDGRPFEVQIRTQAMDREAEFGVASHWDYKEMSTGLRRDSRTGPDRDQISFVRRLLAWQQEIAQDPLEGPARRTIFVLTPMGKVLELPLGATPLDFAYSIHTELGHRCRGARVDEVMVPLNTALRSGQTVEIVAARHVSQRVEAAPPRSAPGVATGERRGDPAGTFRDTGQQVGAGLRGPGNPARVAGSAAGGAAVRQGERLGPSRDWLNPRLGFLKTLRARAKVRQWFHALDEDRDQAVGRARLIRLMRRESAMGVSLDELARRLRFVQPRDLCIAFARDELGARAVELCLRQVKGEACSDVPRLQETGPACGLGHGKVRTRRKASGGDGEGSVRAGMLHKPSGVLVEGVGSLMTQVARCCRPAPPEAIVGFVTRGNGVSVHRCDCLTFRRLFERHPERQIGTQWADR